jgi:DNA anti-recombination protein RmuC
MPDLLQRLNRARLLYCGLGLAALLGWGSFAYMVWSARHLSQEISSLLGERNELIAARNEARAKHEQLQRSAGDLRQVEAKLAAARAEYRRVLEMTEAKAHAASAKEEMTGLLKRIGQAKERERHDQTGSIRQPEPPKRPIR